MSHDVVEHASGCSRGHHVLRFLNYFEELAHCHSGIFEAQVLAFRIRFCTFVGMASAYGKCDREFAIHRVDDNDAPARAYALRSAGTSARLSGRSDFDERCDYDR